MLDRDFLEVRANGFIAQASVERLRDVPSMAVDSLPTDRSNVAMDEFHELPTETATLEIKINCDLADLEPALLFLIGNTTSNNLFVENTSKMNARCFSRELLSRELQTQWLSQYAISQCDGQFVLGPAVFNDFHSHFDCLSKSNVDHSECEHQIQRHSGWVC